MTSIVRSSRTSTSLPAAPGFVVAYFINSDGQEQPFPWRFNRETQQIDLEFVDGFTNSTDMGSTPLFFRGKQFGGTQLVFGLGPNFINWCENVDNDNTTILADPGTVELYEKPLVATANLIAPNQDPNQGETEEKSYPISFENAAGTVEGKYCKTLVFYKPMVITYLREGTRYYRWFGNNYEGNT